jgi:hypothetical protein
MSASKISQEKATVKAPNSDSEIQRFAKKIFQDVKVTIWATNFDRYKYFLTIMSYKEKCMASWT